MFVVSFIEMEKTGRRNLARLEINNSALSLLGSRYDTAFIVFNFDLSELHSNSLEKAYLLNF